MKYNVEVIHFLIKNRGVQGLAFMQITFKKCTTNSYSKNGEVGVKQQFKFVALTSSLVSNKNVFL